MNLSTTVPNVLMLDACSSLCLRASGHFEAIVQTPFGGTVRTYAIADIVVREAAQLRRGGAGDDANERDEIEWNTLIKAGLLRLESGITASEMASFVSLAAQIDDGEAMTIALAESRHYGIVTDDRKARRFLGEVPCWGTPDLLHNWSVGAAVDDSTVAAAVQRIKEHSNFVAPRTHPLFSWWRGLLGNS